MGVILNVRLNCVGFLCLMLMFSLSPLANAQKFDLEVKVMASGDGPIEFANIFITPCSCGGVTDARGIFSIGLEKGEYSIVTTYIGYSADTTILDLDRNLSIGVELSAEGYLLGNVVVSASSARENLEKTVMGVQQLGIEKIKTLPTAIGEVDILKSLTMLPGVSSAGEASNGLSVRGGSLDQNLVLLDQAPVFNTTHLFGLFSVFTPEAIRGVELYQGNMPSKYGGRISSIVDVKVENPSLEKLKVMGGVGFVSNRLTVETPIIKNKLSILAGARVSYNDFLLARVQRLKNTKANFVDGTSKIRYQLNDKNSFYLTTFYSKDLYQLEINSKINSIDSDANIYDYATLNNTLVWISDIGDRTFLTTSLVRSDYSPKILFPQANSENEITFQSNIKNYGFKTEYNTQYSEKLNYTAGLQSDFNILQPGELNSGGIEEVRDQLLPQENGLELSLFANVDWVPSDRFSMSVGLRYTYYMLLGPYQQATYEDEFRRDITEIKQFGNGEIVQSYQSPEPRIGLRAKLTENSSIKASYSRTRQFLQNIYNSTTPLPTSRWKMSDFYIVPQTANTYSLGYYQNFRSDQITFGVEGYYREIDKVLDFKPGAEFFLQEFIERDVLQGEGRNYGVELSMEKPSGKVNGWWNYTYSRSLRIFDSVLAGDRINNNEWFPSDFDRPHVFNGTINYEANAFNTFSVNFTYQTGRPYTIPNATIVTEGIPIPIFLERNNSRLPDYHRLDLSWRIHNITTKKTRWKGDWIFTIYNLYNRNNAFNIYFAGKSTGQAVVNKGSGPLGAYQLSIFSTTLVSLGYNFTFE